jgi:adenylate cyclase
MSSNNPPDLRGRASGGRKLIAIVHMDMVGYSRLIGIDDAETLSRLGTLRRTLIDPAVSEHGGTIVQTAGDSLLISFDSIDGAMRCAVKVQHEVPVRDGEQPPDRRIRFRVGINIGDVIADGTNLHGDGVNIAVRLQAECPPGGVCVSRAIRDHVHDRLGLLFEERGALAMKNIARPVEAFVLRFGPEPAEVIRPLRQVRHEATPRPDRPSIAVLAFDNLSRDPQQDYFADGMAEDIITELSRSRLLFVIARNSSFTYKGHAVDMKQVARELGVRYVLEGSVRRSGDRIRISTQLIDAETGGHVWAERYDRDLADIFAVQDEITDTVARAIEPAISDAEQQRAARKPPGNLSAWEAYQRGLWHFARRTTQDRVRARSIMQQAIDLDPMFAPPHYLLAFLHLHDAAAYIGTTAREAAVLAEPLAQRAIELDPQDADAHAVAALVGVWGGYWDAALARAGRAVAMNPNSVFAHRARAFCLFNFQHYGDARMELATCLRLNSRDPQNWLILLQFAISHYLEADYPASLEVLQRAVGLYASEPQIVIWLAATFGQLGRLAEAQQALRRAEMLLPPGVSLRIPWRVPLRRTEDHEHLLDGLRKAGWEA